MCDHEPLAGPSTDPDGKELQYFSRYEPAFKGLQKLVMDQQWLKSMKYYVKFWSVYIALSSNMVLLFSNSHTGRLESLHNCCLGVCTKTISFSVRTYIYRTILNVDGRKLWEGSTADTPRQKKSIHYYVICQKSYL